MKNKSIILVLLPSFICATIIYLTSMSIEYYPLSFGLIIGLVNWKLHRYNPFFGVVLSVLLSYVAFFIAYFSGEIINPLMNLIFDTVNYSKSEEKRGFITLTIVAFIIAPTLVFYFYKFIFEYSKVKSTKIVILVSILILVFLQYFIYNFYEVISKKINIYMIWQIIMAVALEIIIKKNNILVKNQ